MITRVTWVAALLATMLAGSIAPPAAADLNADLEAAQRRVTALESRIEREEATVRGLQSELKSLTASVAREQQGLDDTRRQLETTRRRVEETKLRLQELRDRLRQRARTVYMRGPLDLIGVLIGADTIADFVSRIGYAARLAREDGKLVLQARAAQAELAEQAAAQERLEREQAAAVSALRARRERTTTVFARQMAVMADLATSRAEAQKLVSQIEGRLAAGQVGRLRRVAGRGMTISYGQWAQDFLATLGAPVSRSNLVAVVAWEAAEGTLATWNPLATTMRMPGATVYNSHGVRNYLSKEQGIEASIKTVRLPNHGYEAIISSLKASAPAMDTGRAINRSDWCRGCAGGTYVVGFIPAVERYYERYAN